MNITEVTQEQETWKYKEKQILTIQEEKTNALRREHDNLKLRHLEFKKTLKKIN